LEKEENTKTNMVYAEEKGKIRKNKNNTRFST